VSTPAGIRPEPSDEEAAAIAAAVEALWPRRVVVVPADHHHATAGWRWSGRWWAKPVAARRDRPWH
jgi:hypothetical protein